MLFVAWSIAVLIAIALVVIAFCLTCGIVAEQKGRSWWWAVLGIFTILGLIVVLLLDRSIAFEVNRRIAIDRMYQRRSSPSEASPMPELRDRSTSRHQSGIVGARGAENPVGAWLLREDGESVVDPASGATQQRRTETSHRVREAQGDESPVAAFLSTRPGREAADSENEMTDDE